MLTSLAHSTRSINIWREKGRNKGTLQEKWVTFLSGSPVPLLQRTLRNLGASLCRSQELRAPLGQALPSTEPDFWQSSANVDEWEECVQCLEFPPYTQIATLNRLISQAGRKVSIPDRLRMDGIVGETEYDSALRKWLASKACGNSYLNWYKSEKHLH